MYFNKFLSSNGTAIDLENIVKLQSCWTGLNPLQAGFYSLQIGLLIFSIFLCLV